MFFHTHQQEEGPDTYVLHINATEAVQIVEAIQGALIATPDAENFSLTLGVVQEGEGTHQHQFAEQGYTIAEEGSTAPAHEHDADGNCIMPTPFDGLIAPKPNGLIVP